MQNYKIVIEYDGTPFNGWQNQKDSNNTIQGNIERSLNILIKEKISITGAGRTDAGVHALNQIANFRTTGKIDEVKFCKSLNALLPDEISVKDVCKVPDDFHARYSAIAREYEYRISLRRRSIERNYCYFLKHKIDIEKIQNAVELFTGEHSFKSLCKNKEDKHDFKCQVFVLKINSDDELIKITIKANRFLHSMVRALTGTLVEIGRNKLSISEVKKNFKKGERIKAYYLPANGLFLKKIYY